MMAPASLLSAMAIITGGELATGIPQRARTWNTL